MDEEKGVYRVLLGKPQGKRPLWRPRRRLVDNIRMDLQEVGCGHVARMGEERGVYRVLVGKPEGNNHWGDLGVDGWIILGWISRRWDVGMWTGLGWPRIGTGGVRL